MKLPEPLFFAAVVVGLLFMGGLAVLLHVTGTPLDSVAKLGAIMVPLAATLISAWIGRSQVTPVSTAEDIATKALRMPTPPEDEIKTIAQGLVAKGSSK